MSLKKRVARMESRPPSPHLVARGMKQFRETGELPPNPRVAQQVERMVAFLREAAKVSGIPDPFLGSR